MVEVYSVNIIFWNEDIFKLLNSLHAEFFRGNMNILAFYVIAPHWHDTNSWNPSSSKTRAYLFYNILAADDLLTQWARTSANHDIYYVEQDSFGPCTLRADILVLKPEYSRITMAGDVLAQDLI